MKIIHYPWRCALSDKKWECLPIPDQGKISPMIGAFCINEDGGIDELPGPTRCQGKGQSRWEESAQKKFIYDWKAVPQFQTRENNLSYQKLNFSLTDLFIRMSDFLYVWRESKGKRLTDRSIQDACDDLRLYLGEEKDFASESLIVRISKELEPILKGIVEDPRLVLKRVHRQVPLDRLQEIDLYALQNYARQPGRTATMKAGARQRLMAVMREESADTYENQVVKSFLEKSLLLAKTYVGEMCGRCPMQKNCSKKAVVGEQCCSKRVKNVRAYLGFCQQLLQNASFMAVTQLVEPRSKPNYVLQQNPRYLKVWKYYQRLLRQEDIEANVWRWQRRCWADAARLQMLLFWKERIALINGFQMVTSQKPFMIREENVKGAWLCPDPFEDAAIFAVADYYVTLYLLNANELQQLVGETEDIALLNADFYWVTIASGNQFKLRVLPVWCFCPDLQWKDVDKLGSSVCKETKTLLKGVDSVDSKRSIVLYPGEKTDTTIAIGDYCFWTVNFFKPDQNIFFDKLQKILQRMIEK